MSFRLSRGKKSWKGWCKTIPTSVLHQYMYVFVYTYFSAHMEPHTCEYTHTHPIHIYLSLFAEIWLYLFIIWAFADCRMNASRRYIKILPNLLPTKYSWLKLTWIRTNIMWENSEVGLFCFLSILKCFIYGNFHFWTTVVNECATKSWWHPSSHYSFEKFLPNSTIVLFSS